MNKRKFFTAVCFGLLTSCSWANAETIVDYGFSVGTGRDGRTTTPQPASLVAGHVTAGKLTPVLMGAPSSDNTANGMGFEGTWGFLGPRKYPRGIDNIYFSFSLNIADGFQADFQALSFTYRAPKLDGEHSVYWDVRCSVDNFQQPLKVVSTKETGQGKPTPSGDISLESLKGVKGNIEFRIYIYEETEETVTGGQCRLGDIKVTGTVVPAA
ncbi:hypothetical protein H5P28_05265 [Ruficoccus amylovorans]|uniref:Uncharacterized protein n=1 Tax=Ruficoccus amylovorans TaxID=1804625 RepID=A0A842HDK4_9BACT|nr:hypothetical protein [Ruficoccus amylovorans]MBC2593667.1 hypothetical protein [Ruficoccus amylovorans]